MLLLFLYRKAHFHLMHGGVLAIEVQLVPELEGATVLLDGIAGLGAENGSGKALLDHLGQQAGVVNVGVGDKNKVNGGRLIEFRFTVAGFYGLVALIYFAICFPLTLGSRVLERRMRVQR